MSIQLSDPILSKFAQGQWREAITLYVEDRAGKAVKALCAANPNDPAAVAKLQEEIRQLEKLACIEEAVTKFEETKAASKITKQSP